MTGEQAFNKYYDKVFKNKRRAREYRGGRPVWENAHAAHKVDWDAWAEGYTDTPPPVYFPRCLPYRKD